MKTIPDIVSDAIHTDVDHHNSDDKRIIKRYKSATKTAKQDIDDIFISLCGWSLNTIIQNRRNHRG
jgi:hypothetical protein